MKKISVIVPIFNLEQYIKKCYDSIKKQTYNNWELFFIIDGATDRSYEVCKNIEREDSNVHVIKTENKGVSHARNVGIEYAVGEYITFIDGDDYIEEDFFKMLINKIETDNSDVCFAKYYYKDNNRHKTSLIDFDDMDSKELLHYHLKFEFISSLCFGIYKKDLMKNIFLVEKIKSYEDWEFLFQILQNCKKVSMVDGGFYHYVTRQGSASKSKFNESKLTAFYIVSEVNKKIHDKKEYEKELLNLEIQVLLRIVVIYASMGTAKQEYKNILKKIARKNFKKIKNNNILTLKQKIYVILICISPDLYKMFFKMKNKI